MSCQSLAEKTIYILNKEITDEIKDILNKQDGNQITFNYPITINRVIGLLNAVYHEGYISYTKILLEKVVVPTKQPGGLLIGGTEIALVYDMKEKGNYHYLNQFDIEFKLKVLQALTRDYK